MISILGKRVQIQDIDTVFLLDDDAPPSKLASRCIIVDKKLTSDTALMMQAFCDGVHADVWRCLVQKTDAKAELLTRITALIVKSAYRPYRPRLNQLDLLAILLENCPDAVLDTDVFVWTGRFFDRIVCDDINVVLNKDIATMQNHAESCWCF